MTPNWRLLLTRLEIFLRCLFASFDRDFDCTRRDTLLVIDALQVCRLMHKGSRWYLAPSVEIHPVFPALFYRVPVSLGYEFGDVPKTCKGPVFFSVRSCRCVGASRRDAEDIGLLRRVN